MFNILSNVARTKFKYWNKKLLLLLPKRNYSICDPLKLTVIGADGKLGRCVCMILKHSPLIDELCIHDIKPTDGLAMELNHIDTKCKVTHFTGKDLGNALNNSRIVLVVASAPGSHGLTLDKMWLPNAHIIQEIMINFARYCPSALLAVNTNPINSIIPMSCEILKKCGCYNPHGIFGITTLDVVRTNTFVAQLFGLNPECVTVPVIGGHSEETILPVLSLASPCTEFEPNELESITKNVKFAHENALRLSKPVIAPFLAEAFAVARFTIALVKAVEGESQNLVESAFVPSTVHPYVKYLATPIKLGPTGIQTNLGIPKLSDYEQCLFDNSIQCLINDCQRGELYVGVEDPKQCNICSDDINEKCPKDFCEQPRKTHV